MPGPLTSRTSPTQVGYRHRSVLRTVADLLIPPACVGCQTPLAEGHVLCAPCWRDVRFIRAPLCDRLGTPLPYDPGGETVVSARALSEPPDYDRARAVAIHAGVTRRLVLGFKYHDRLDARQLFGRWLMMAGTGLIDAADLVLPVPMHPWRLAARRFNQSAVLAKEIGRLSGLPVHYQVLLRTKRTPQQVTLTGAKRLRNPRGAFQLSDRGKRLASGRSILLIDDVITTGATVNACARALKAAGAAHVDVLALTMATGDPDDLMDVYV